MTKLKLVFLMLAMLGVCRANTISGQSCLTPSAPIGSYLFPSQGFPNGCDVGDLNYTFLEFGKLTRSSSGRYNFDSDGGVITPDNLLVRPMVKSDGSSGIRLESSAFQSDFSDMPELYFLSFRVDPPPILAGEELSLVQVSSDFARSGSQRLSQPGDVRVTEYVCPENVFARVTTSPNASANRCAGVGNSNTIDPLLLSVSLSQPDDSVLFGRAVSLYSVQMYIQLSGDLRGSGFIGIDSTPIVVAAVPEPSFLGLTAIGFGILAWRTRKLRPR